ncbi:hypothetical protein ES703_107473 [subsurface metagenome]
MFEKTQSFDMNGQNYEGIRQKVEHILQKDLMYSTNTKRLGKTLFRISYFNEDIDKEEQESKVLKPLHFFNGICRQIH